MHDDFPALPADDFDAVVDAILADDGRPLPSTTSTTFEPFPGPVSG
jgi:hypothetical protein